MKLKDVDLDNTTPSTWQAAAARPSISIRAKTSAKSSSISGKDKVVGAICHGALALGNIPERVRGRRTTGYTLEADKELEPMFGSSFRPCSRKSGSRYARVGANDPYVIGDGKLRRRGSAPPWTAGNFRILGPKQRADPSNSPYFGVAEKLHRLLVGFDDSSRVHCRISDQSDLGCLRFTRRASEKVIF
jgi:hypothetical protein